MLPDCVRRNTVNRENNAINVVENEVSFEKIDPIWLRAAEIAASLDDRLLAAQILISGIDGKGSLPAHMMTLLKESPPGGIMLFRYNLDADNDSIRSLVMQTAELIAGEAEIPPFVAVDHEGGSVNRFRRGTADLPDASFYRELSIAEGEPAALTILEIDSIRAGRELNDLGINLNLAPVAEYMNDNNSVFLKSRSYGTDPLFTADAAAAFIRGMELAGVLCVIKHFPGSAGTDPHYSASVIGGDRDALDELVFPFTALVEKGCAKAVMVAHSAVPALDSKIASLSQIVMQDWLRGDIGFQGIIIADDFSMAAAGGQNPEDAAILSVAAGANMIIVWQSDLKRTHSAFVSALADGRLSRERAREAAQRIIYEKILLGLM
ncbi:MAG: glycoside hydrolase family 3 protein [Treponema sp.]|jgi:beta-N-acetylhexosaminidase|nr:glycoside hydrolase family 3 protein [Treponema sp.]